MPAPRTTPAAIERAITAVKNQGLAIGAVVVTNDGTIRIETRPPESLDVAPATVHPLQPKKWASR